jgi:Fe-S cluster biogenesis protein NfuA
MAITILDIQKIINEDINPGLEMHGGNISIHEFNENDNSLKLIMGGGCHGCASSKITMMLGVERHFREVFPDIGDIEDVTDHLAGANPYYAQE